MARKPKVLDIENPPEVSEISNALRPLRIDITAEDIRTGKPLDPTQCAAAQCILRTVPNAEKVRVHRGITLIQQKGKWTRYITSTSVRLETIIYDRGGQFIPGEYDLLPVPMSYSESHKPKKKRSPSAPTNRRMGKRQTIPGVRVTARHKTRREGEEGDE